MVLGQNSGAFTPYPAPSSQHSAPGITKGAKSSPYFNWSQKLVYVHKHIRQYMFKYYQKFQGCLTLNLVFKHAGVTTKPHLPNSLLF